MTGGSAFDAHAVADRLVRDIRVGTVLDLGSPRQLAEALRARGVSVTSLDRPDAASLRAHSSREYDLIVRIDGVDDIEQLPEDAEALVTEICARTADVILAPGLGLSTPAAGGRRARRSPWAQLFAAHGFFLDIDYDVTFVSPLAMRFRRSPEGRGPARPSDEGSLAEALQRLRRTMEEKDQLILRLNADVLSLRNSVAWKTAARLRPMFQRWLRADSERLHIYWTLRRSLEVLVEEGVVSVFQRARHKIRSGLRGHGARVRVPRGDAAYDRNAQYALWVPLHTPRTTDLEAMRRASQTLSYQPLISIVTPVHDTDEGFLRRAIDSVRAQAYQNWQLCLANDGSQTPHVRAVLDDYARLDPRIRVAHLPVNLGIAAAANHAGQIASGEFMGFLDHDDELSPDALFEVAKLLADHPTLDLVYSDEDKLEPDDRRVDPFFKPDWSPDLLLSMNYITHFAVVRRSLLQEIGGFRLGYDGSQDYDLLLRITERTARIAHIPKVLYHWRKTPGSAAVSPHTKPYAHEAGRRALAEALRRRRCDGSVDSVDPGMYRIRYQVQGKPLVSIIIPTRGAWPLLRQCLHSLESNTEYAPYEVIILDNDSRDPATLTYLDSIAARHRVYRHPGPFNFSTINNVGVGKARGDYVLFLNNDVQISRPDWLLAMVEQAQRSEVGAVGAKLVYPDGRIQHAGLVLSVQRPPAHAFRLQRPDDPGYHRFADVIRNCSAVTGACMMVRRRLFLDIGGFDQRFRFAYNDVDLCLRLRRNGYLIVYTPFAVLYHHESATRGTLHPPEEELLYRQLWGETIVRGDPYYNVNLSQTREDWSLELGRRPIE